MRNNLILDTIWYGVVRQFKKLPNKVLQSQFEKSHLNCSKYLSSEDL